MAGSNNPTEFDNRLAKVPRKPTRFTPRLQGICQKKPVKRPCSLQKSVTLVPSWSKQRKTYCAHNLSRTAIVESGTQISAVPFVEQTRAAFDTVHSEGAARVPTELAQNVFGGKCLPDVRFVATCSISFAANCRRLTGPYTFLNSSNSLPSTTLAMTSRTSYVCRASAGTIPAISSGLYSGGGAPEEGAAAGAPLEARWRLPTMRRPSASACVSSEKGERI